MFKILFLVTNLTQSNHFDCITYRLDLNLIKK